MSDFALRILFIVQGEGRGHLTQCIAMKRLLDEAGHEICGVLVGAGAGKKLPDYFFERIQAPVTQFQSPVFLTDGKKKGVRLLPTLKKSFSYSELSIYRQSLRLMDERIRELRPDIIINFYEPLTGLYNHFYKNIIPVVCIAHQYLFHHPRFAFPKGRYLDRFAIKLFTRLTSYRATKRLALSFYHLPDHAEGNIAVVPPLLRHEVFEQEIRQGDYLLVYLLNSGYMEEIIRWHEAHPEIALHCFTDKQDMKEEWRYDNTLTFHRLNDMKFLRMMAGCRAFVSTAGFESVCESMYFGKPVMMVPVQGHFEQFCNSRDACKAGAGIYADSFELTKALDAIEAHATDPRIFRHWLHSGSHKFLEEIHQFKPLPTKVQLRETSDQ